MTVLDNVGIIPVIRCDSPDVAVRVTEVLIAAGLRVAEITLTVPNAIDAIARLARRRGEQRALIGAGTVTTADAARDAIRAGAEFIVSPCLVPEVIDVAIAAHVPVFQARSRRRRFCRQCVPAPISSKSFRPDR
jgi:2-dehydro-3-deoxyphosphogluconate aldolase/(4S)-4-hydroxy-2-oxoglutarate aldolase